MFLESTDGKRRVWKESGYFAGGGLTMGLKRGVEKLWVRNGWSGVPKFCNDEDRRRGDSCGRQDEPAECVNGACIVGQDWYGAGTKLVKQVVIPLKTCDTRLTA